MASGKERDEGKGPGVDLAVIGGSGLYEMDGLEERGRVVVIGATNRIDAIDPALRRGGRFDREIEIGVPDRRGRLEILQIHTRGMPLADDVDLEKLADITHGYTGADLAALCREAAMKALRRYLPQIDLEQERIPVEVLEKMEVRMEDFMAAYKEITPTAIREVYIEVPRVRWSDIGGLEEVKQELREAVEWPLKYPDKFKAMGIEPPKGVLLYGPPGCGKTLLAKAVANESDAAFFAINGPEIMSKYYGESEARLREIFERAEKNAPAIIFIDEIDAIAPKREEVTGEVERRVVAQLLALMDGLKGRGNVIVIGATNRINAIDPALRRPGRFDREVTIDLPAQVADDWTEAGLFEKSLGPGKLDIVLIMDGTGSMSDFTAGIIDQLHRLVDMLQAGHHDFRMAMLHTDQTPDGMFKFRFYDGNTERDRLLADIDYWFVRTGGEWWSPTVNYDAILASPWYRFRPEARKVVLVLTDIVPGTVYGTFWYPISCTNVTATAVELFAAEQGVEIYYSRNPSPHPNAEDYCQPDMNPRACPGGNEQWGITGSGLGDLAWPGGGSAVQLDWPLDAADVYGKLTGGDQQLADSQYLLTWESNFDLYDPVSLPGHEEEYRVEVTLAVSDPELPGELLDNVFSAPIKVPSYTLDFVMQDEEGNAATADDLRADLFFDVAGRLFEREHSLMGDETGLVTLTGVVAGRYRLVFQDSSRYGYSVENLRARDELQFDMPAADHSLEPFRVTTGEHLSDRYKLLGLLQDLDDWHLSGDPFARFAAAAREWLAELESSGGGLSWREQIAVKRLIVAVSGYANLAEYAQFESQLAVRDFGGMIDQIAAVIDQIKQLRAGLDLDWKQQIVAGMLKVIYGVLTEGRFNAVLEAVQHGLTALINYAASEAFDDTIDLVLDKFEELGVPGQAGAYVRILVKLVKEIASDNDAAANRAALWEAAREMGLRVALDATAALVKDQVVDRAFAELELDTPLQRSLKALVKELVDAAFSENGFNCVYNCSNISIIWCY